MFQEIPSGIDIKSNTDKRNDDTLRSPETVQAKMKHGHLNDLGLGSLISYFFCILASVSIRSSGLGSDTLENGILITFLAFIISICLTLLFLAMAGSYMLRHDNHKRLAIISGVLMVLGPGLCVVENYFVISNLLLMFLFFSLSGCGYAIALLIWGRVLSVKEGDGASRQVLVDICAAVIVMVVVSVTPEMISCLIIACLGLMAGLIGSMKAVAEYAKGESKKQIVVSDTRNAIPKTSYFVGGTLWMVFGVFLSLLSGVSVFSGYLNVAAVAVVSLAAFAGIIIVRQHRNPNINLSKVSWAAVPLLVTGLVIYVAGDPQLLKLATALIVFSMIISYLHLMTHFAALAHRPNMLSDQMFAWGWLAPYAGMFIGVFAGIILRIIGDPAIKLFLPIVGGILVIVLIVSMRSVEVISSRRREKEAGKQTDTGTLENYQAQMNEVFSDMGLSLREKEVALLILQGRSQAVIANQLFVAPSTVNTHVKHIYAKCNVSSKQEFIALCQEKFEGRSIESAIVKSVTGRTDF